MKRSLVFTAAVVLFISLHAFAQQTYVNRVGFFTGYSYMNTPSLKLGQHGFNTSGGVNISRWMELGADFSVLKGDTTLGISDTILAPKLAPILAGAGIPASALANVTIPANATTYTYQIGGQINIRKWNSFTPFIRPVLGAMHEMVDVKIANPALTPIFQAVGLKPHAGDTVPMYGIGGGIDLNPTKHFGLRFSVDYAHSAMFDNILRPQNTVRFSVGPTFKLGELKQKAK